MTDYGDRFYQGILDELAEAQAQADATMRDMGIEPPDPKLDTAVQSCRIDNMDSTCPNCTDIGQSGAHSGGTPAEPIDFEALVNELLSQWHTPGGYPEIDPAEIDLSEIIAWVNAGCP